MKKAAPAMKESKKQEQEQDQERLEGRKKTLPPG